MNEDTEGPKEMRAKLADLYDVAYWADPSQENVTAEQLKDMGISSKLVPFIDYFAYECNIMGKINLLGRLKFLRVFPNLLTENAREALQVMIHPEQMDNGTRGVVEFAAAIGINEFKVDEEYFNYLKTFLK